MTHRIDTVAATFRSPPAPPKEGRGDVENKTLRVETRSFVKRNAAGFNRRTAQEVSMTLRTESVAATFRSPPASPIEGRGDLKHETLRSNPQLRKMKVAGFSRRIEG